MQHNETLVGQRWSAWVVCGGDPNVLFIVFFFFFALNLMTPHFFHYGC